MTFGASLIARGSNVDAAAMFGVAGCARRSCRLSCMVDWAVVAVEASVVGSFRGKCARCLHVTSGAFFFEDGVGFGQSATAIHARVFKNGAFGDPDKRD